MRIRRDSLRVEPLRAGAWTVVQVLFYLLLFEVALATISSYHDWRPNLGRGIFWYGYHAGFALLALLANLALELLRGASVPRRLAVWGVVMGALGVYSAASWPSLPLAVPFVHACALAAIAVREGAGWYVMRKGAEPASV